MIGAITVIACILLWIGSILKDINNNLVSFATLYQEDKHR